MWDLFQREIPLFNNAKKAHQNEICKIALYRLSFKHYDPALYLQLQYLSIQDTYVMIKIIGDNDLLCNSRLSVRIKVFTYLKLAVDKSWDTDLFDVLFAKLFTLGQSMSFSAQIIDSDLFIISGNKGLVSCKIAWNREKHHTICRDLFASGSSNIEPMQIENDMEILGAI